MVGGDTDPVRFVKPAVLATLLVLAVPAVTTSWPRVRSPPGSAIVGSSKVKIKFVFGPLPLALEAERELVKTPALAVGIPVISPEVALMVRPAGREAAAKEEGELSAVTGKENETPRVAVWVFAEVILGVALRFTVRFAVPVPVALAAERVTVKVPAATVGVPEMRPVEVLMERPAGSPVAL